VVLIIDTNIAIELRDSNPDILEKIEHSEEPIIMSVVTRIELEGGFHGTRDTPGVRRSRLDTLYVSVPTIPLTEKSAETYRRIVEAAGYSRRKILDRMIAAQALEHGATLVTRNASDFADIPGLNLVVW